MNGRSNSGHSSRCSRRAYLTAGASALAASAGCFDVLAPADSDDGDSPETTVDDVETALFDGHLVALARGREGPVGVDPEATTTPVQAGLDILGANEGGELRLPPAALFEREPIRPYTDTAIVGFGPGVTEVNLPRDTDGVRFDRPGGVSRVRLEGFALNGPGGTDLSGVAIHHTGGDTQNLTVGRILFWGWNNAVYRVDEDSGPFQCRHDLLTVYECDAGDEDGLFEFSSSYGPANWFGTIAAYPTAQYSGQNSTAFFTRGGTQHIDHLTLGGTVGSAVYQFGGSQFRAEGIHWEPNDPLGAPAAIARLFGRGPATIGNVKQASGTTPYVYEVGTDPEFGGRPASKRLGTYQQVGTDGELTENVVNLAAPADPSMPSFYDGVAADVSVTHGESETGGFRALGEAGAGVDAS